MRKTSTNLDYALDTFSRFVAEDIYYEIANRRKTTYLFTRFRVNKKK